jgi:hypothetical protein
MALTGDRRINPNNNAAPSRAFPDTPAPHATAAKTYIAVVTVPAADDTESRVLVQYLAPPAAHATNDLQYALKITVTGDDTTGGSTSVPSWGLITAGAVG